MVFDPRPEYRIDVTTGHLSATTPRAYTEDVSSHSRGLVGGDTWQAGLIPDPEREVRKPTT